MQKPIAFAREVGFTALSSVFREAVCHTKSRKTSLKTKHLSKKSIVSLMPIKTNKPFCCSHFTVTLKEKLSSGVLEVDANWPNRFDKEQLVEVFGFDTRLSDESLENLEEEVPGNTLTFAAAISL